MPLIKVSWGSLDVLVIDMPPGTGDVHLSVSQHVKLAGSVVVSTPQDLALIDARRAIHMFAKLGVPSLGLVQNMSSYVCTKCGHEEHLFGQEGVRRLAAELDCELLGSIPLNGELREASDLGRPLVIEKEAHPVALAYREICDKIVKKLNF